MAEVCCRFMVMLMLMVSLAAIVVAMLTDYWYEVKAEGTMTPQQKMENNFRFGFWRRCYDEMPKTFSSGEVDESGGSCIWIYKDLLPEDEGVLSSDQKVRMHLMRATLGLSIASAACLLFALLTLVCSWCPGDCRTPQRAATYTAAMVIVVFAFMSGMASGICFIAARDVEDKDLQIYDIGQNGQVEVDTRYLWSFMLHWCGTGLALVTACVLLHRVATSYNSVTNKGHHYHYSY